MKTEFVLYEDKDYADLINMIKALYQEDPEGEPMNSQKIKMTICEFENHPDKVGVYMLKSQGQNIGYAILVYFWSNEYGGTIVNVDELYVVESHRGKGVSTEFMDFVGRLENAVAVQLEVTPSNHRALAYYKRLGFELSPNTHLLKHS